MRKFIPTLAALCATLLSPVLLQAPLAQAAGSSAAAAVSGRVIVKYRTEAPLLRMQAQSASATAVERADQMTTLGRRTGLTLRAGRDVAERSHVVFADGLTSDQLAQKLAGDPDVEYAVPDQRRRAMEVPNDLYYPPAPGQAAPNGQWYLRPPTSTVKSSINAQQAWDVTAGSSSIVVAVLDSGIRFDHPDLIKVANGGNVLDGYDMITDPQTANDGGGRDADASDPGDWITASEAGRPPFEPCGEQQSRWHGTGTAALIGAATNNGTGIASVGRNVRILPVRVLGKCGGFDSDIIPAMRWAAGLPVAGVPNNSNPARVINMSLGGVGACSQAYRDAVDQIVGLGTVIVASAGNDTGHAVNSPANCPGIMAVGGLRHTGTKVAFSDVGPELTISAPGGNCVNLTGTCLYPIVTAWNFGSRGPGASGYDTEATGTSYSAPLVAGTVGLMLSIDPTLTPLQVKLILQGTARPFPGLTGANPECTAPQYDTAGKPIDQDECECTNGTCGAGMLDAFAAVNETLAGGIGKGVQARIDLDSRNARAGQPLTLSAANSIAQAGVGIKSYFWQIIDVGPNGTVSAFNETGTVTATGPTVTITPRISGQFVVALTVTDNQNVSSTPTEMAIVARDSPSGGGAVGAGWLALLGLAVLALRRTGRRAA